MANPTEREQPSASWAATAAPEQPDATNAAGNRAPESPTDAFRAAALLFSELKAYFGYYVRARLHAIKLTARTAGVYAVLAIVGGIVGATAIVVATVLLITGLCNLLNYLFLFIAVWLVPWAGQLVTALLLLGGGAGVGWLILHRMFEASRRRTVEQDERERHQQWSKFGHDVHDRAKHG